MAIECTYCGSTRNIQNDHIIAQSKGGVTTTPACSICNLSKGPKPLMEWFRWIKKKDPYRWQRIVSHNYNKRNSISAKVRTVRDE